MKKLTNVWIKVLMKISKARLNYVVGDDRLRILSLTLAYK